MKENEKAQQAKSVKINAHAGSNQQINAGTNQKINPGSNQKINAGSNQIKINAAGSNQKINAGDQFRTIDVKRRNGEVEIPEGMKIFCFYELYDSHSSRSRN